MEIKNITDRKFFDGQNMLSILIAIIIGTFYDISYVSGTIYAAYLIGFAILYQTVITICTYKTKQAIQSILDKGLWNVLVKNIDIRDLKDFLNSNLMFCGFTYLIIILDIVLYLLHISMLDNIYIIVIVFGTFNLADQIKIINLLKK